jgi:hypothetical protein
MEIRILNVNVPTVIMVKSRVYIVLVVAEADCMHLVDPPPAAIHVSPVKVSRIFFAPETMLASVHPVIALPVSSSFTSQVAIISYLLYPIPCRASQAVVPVAAARTPAPW